MKYKFVNVYLVSREYGGPEEGGWYYDAGQLLKCMPVPPSKAEALLDKVTAWCKQMNDGTMPRSSVIGSPDYLCRLSPNPGKDYPAERPFYE